MNLRNKGVVEVTEKIGRMTDTVVSRSKPLSPIVLAPVIFFIAILIKLDPYDLVLLRIIDGGVVSDFTYFRSRSFLSKKYSHSIKWWRSALGPSHNVGV